MFRNSVLILCSILFLLTANGCKKGCGDKVCMNGGTCNNNTCQCAGRYGGEHCDSLCAKGFEGTSCSTPSRDKFVKYWNATSTDQTTNIQTTFTLAITSNSSNKLYLNLDNFNNQGYTVICIMTDYNTFVPISQTTTGALHYALDMSSGAGYLKGTMLTINLTLPAPAGTSYFITAQPQQ